VQQADFVACSTYAGFVSTLALVVVVLAVLLPTTTF
jgi:hypothetical protein